jgi:MFS family permease
MTSLARAAAARSAAASDDTRGPRLSVVLSIGSIITVAFAGSVLVTPLYTLYRHKFGFSELTLTLVYAVYAIGNVVALLLFGQLSDQIGRKRAALPALGLAIASALLFVFAHSTMWLFGARALIGLAVGVASGTGTAWLAEEYGPARRSTATQAAATANLAGIAFGPLVGGLLAQYVRWPLVLPFVVYIAAVLGVAVAIGRLVETRRPSARRLADVRLRPRLGVPRQLIGAFTPPAVTGFVIFAVGGLYFALIPSIVVQDLHETNIAVSAAVVVELGVVSAVVTVLSRRVRPAAAMTAGLVLLLPAVALVVTAQAARSMPLLLAATALAGLTLALGYRGSLRIVNDIAPDERRAEVVSSYFIACFVGNSVPVIGVGVLSTLTTPLSASVVFAGTLAVLSVAALAWRHRAADPDRTD